MIPYMDLEEQVDADFGRARRKAFLRKLMAAQGSVPGRMPCFEEVKRELGVAGGMHLGRKVVPLTRVVGSVGRCSEFDGVFLPTGEGARTRWERVDRAFQRGKDLPPASQYKVGDSYFVLDGNHRVSVARYHGVEWTDAEVTEFRARSPRNGITLGVPTS